MLGMPALQIGGELARGKILQRIAAEEKLVQDGLAGTSCAPRINCASRAVGQRL